MNILQRLIVLEGLDGSGTTTQLRLLADRLARENKPHAATFEPTDGPVGKMLRSILALETKAHPRTIALLYAADRNEHLYRPVSGMEARVKKGEIVICDRYLFSSLAYQSIDCGMEYVAALNGAFPLPQCLIFLDTPVEVCQERLQGRDTVELFDSFEFQARVREGYLEAIDRYRGTEMSISVLDGDRPAGIIHSDVWKILTGLPIFGV
jgi:dTMP kinase